MANYRLLDEVIYITFPTIFLIDAFLALTRSLQWNKLGIIKILSLQEPLITSVQQNVTLTHITESLSNKIIEHIVQSVEKSGAKVQVLMAQEAPKILCAAHGVAPLWLAALWRLQ